MRTRLAFLFVLAGLFGPALALGGDLKDNPNYQVWARFKPGSSSTVTADIRDGDGNMHIETTRTLVSVTDDEVVIKTVSKLRRKGKETTQQPISQTIKAKTDKDEIKETGDKDMDAMGKTFKCRVWDSTGPKAAEKPKPGEHKTIEPGAMKATIYVSGDVPGGVVRLDGVGPNGENVTFVLTKFEAK
jgi:hypothetical protein